MLQLVLLVNKKIYKKILSTIIYTMADNKKSQSSKAESKSESKSEFKKYYDNPEWRKKYLAYLKERIQCECGAMVQRVQVARHKRRKKHIKLVNEKIEKQKMITNKKMENEIAKLKKKVKQLTNKIHQLDSK
jgi:uncharacterized protein YceH (UPF0502 family)